MSITSISIILKSFEDTCIDSDQHYTQTLLIYCIIARGQKEKSMIESICRATHLSRLISYLSLASSNQSSAVSSSKWSQSTSEDINTFHRNGHITFLDNKTTLIKQSDTDKNITSISRLIRTKQN